MKRSENEENGEAKRAMVKQEALGYGYDSSYMNYSTAAAISSTNNQPLPGQPPLPPMPPPPGAVPPPPHIFGTVHSQMTPIQTWAHPSSPWQWMAQPASSLPTLSPRDIAVSNYQREIPPRGNYIRSDRFSHSRNHVYPQRGKFHRNKNRRHPRFDQATGQFDQAAYFGAAVPGGISLDWQRGGFSASTAVILPSQHMKPAPTGVATITRHGGESGDRDVQIASEDVVVKKNKQRKPMSQSYPSRPWNREDAEKALQIENEFNKTIKAQSLIIKFPDPDLSKDIVREFHPGIQNIHFQSPSGPRYCFVQMAENVQIDEAIKELERIPFGVGHLKAERKSLRDEDNPMPEEIDPYTLYIGNLPESVNVNEVKNKFPSAARVDVGYAQKMRNTRYAFIRYNSVDESISAYKKAHDLMWDTRSIIVRFRRQRGNTCLPGEPKANVKKVKEELAAGQVKEEQQANCDQQSQSKQDNNVQNHKRLQATDNVQNKAVCPTRQQNNGLAPTSQSSETLPTSVAPAKTTQQQQQQPWTSQPPQIPSASEAPPPLPIESDQVTEMVLLTEIKEEPKDYEEMDGHIQTEDEVDDDDDEEEEEDDFDDDEDDDDDDNDEDDDDDDDEEEDMDENKMLVADEKLEESNNDAEPMDHLDRMFNELENTTGDIGL